MYNGTILHNWTVTILVIIYHSYIFLFTSGRSWEQKVEDVREKLIEKGAYGFVVASLDEVACMLTYHFNPMFFFLHLSFATQSDYYIINSV